MRKKATTADFLRVSDIAIGDQGKADALRPLLRDGKRCQAADWSRAFVRTATITELRAIVGVLADALEDIGDKRARRGNPGGIASMKALREAMRAEKPERDSLKRAASIYHGLVAAKNTLSDRSAAPLAKKKAHAALLAANALPEPSRTFETRARAAAANSVHVSERKVSAFLKSTG